MLGKNLTNRAELQIKRKKPKLKINHYLIWSIITKAMHLSAYFELVGLINLGVCIYLNRYIKSLKVDEEVN